MTIVAGRYQLGQLLGSGGVASVYWSIDCQTQREVALKVIPFGDQAIEHFERFRFEALALSRLKSRHVARVHDFGRDPEIGLYLVMEVIDGVPLEKTAFARSLQPAEVIRVGRCILDALAEAHDAGLVHRDIKPSNVLVPRTSTPLDDVRVLDFGIARSARREQIIAALGEGRRKGAGRVIGTPAYMAPEQLLDEEVGPPADIYATGLVLFNLLASEPLFEGENLREQLLARTRKEPQVSERVVGGLSEFLGRMLRRDPAQRFRNGREALAGLAQIDMPEKDIGTAPDLFLVRPVLETSRKTGNLHLLTATASERALGTMGRSQSGWSERPETLEKTSVDAARTETLPVKFPSKGPRLCRLVSNPVEALRDGLHALDIAMIDALGRRERGEDFGRMARALALALRLELDAAAIVLEPIGARNDIARAIGATVIAPRARRATRLRVDFDRTDSWVDTIEPELAAMLSAMGGALTGRDDAARNEDRCRRAIARISDPSDPVSVTARMGQLTAAWLAGMVPTSQAIGEMVRLKESSSDGLSPFNVVLRSMMLGAVGFRGDEHLARECLDKASRLAADSSNTLLESRASVAWGGMLVEIPGRVEQGLSVLERATTLLAHGDAPSLEHIAEHNRGAALIIQQRFEEGAHHLARARSAAKGELSLEHELISCTDEAMAHVFQGNYEAATRVLLDLADERIRNTSGRTGALAYLTRSLYALVFRGLELAQLELRRALQSASEAEADGGDVTLIAELLGILYASARSEPVDLLGRAGQLEKLAQDHGFASFYWFENLRAAVRHIRDDSMRLVLSDTLERLIVMLVPVHQAVPVPGRS